MPKLESIFPTVVYRARLSRAGSLNSKLLQDIKSFRAQDKMGQQWSQQNYRGGYTSYASLNDMHFRSPVFAQFADLLHPHALAYAKSQGWNLRGLRLEMTDLWMNVMPRGTYHNLHLHPHSVISGAYFVSAPPKSVSLRLEDPRMIYYMNAPVKTGKGKNSSLYYEVTPSPGTFVLFESWLRHEVPRNESATPRISLSFNYSLVNDDI